MADESTSESSSATTQGRVTGVIVPPPDIRAVVDKTAQFVARNGRSFERKIAGETVSAKFAFLRASDPYHAYYEQKVSEITEQNALEAERAAAAASEPQDSSSSSAEPAAAATDADADTATAADGAADTTAQTAVADDSGAVVVERKAVEAATAKVVKKIKETALEPPDEEQFKIKHPVLSALDQEILYLTAQYTALSGTSFLEGLATREQRNPQFDFLKPTHAHFAYFTALVESYAKVLARTESQMQRCVHASVSYDPLFMVLTVICYVP